MLLWLVDNGQGEEALRRLPAVEAAHPEPARLLLRVGQALVREPRGRGRGSSSSARSPSTPRAPSALAWAGPLRRGGRGRSPPAPTPPARGLLLVQALAAPGAEARRSSGSPAAATAASLLLVGSTALQLHRPDLALRFLDEGIAQDPRTAALREKRGLALAMLERPAEARAELEEARRLDPASASICLNLAVLDAQDGRFDAARALAGDALRLQPDYPQARGLLEALGRAR